VSLVTACGFHPAAVTLIAGLTNDQHDLSGNQYSINLAFLQAEVRAIIVNNLDLVFLKQSGEIASAIYEIMDSCLDSRIQNPCSFKITDVNNRLFQD
jgi:hypothetical protein